jgi:hypothetical protein
MNYTYKKTYSTLNELLNEMFPPIADQENKPRLRISEQWNNSQYWKAPMASMEDLELELKKEKAAPKK